MITTKYIKLLDLYMRINDLNSKIANYFLKFHVLNYDCVISKIKCHTFKISK